MNDSLNDSLQPSQLRCLEAEFETNKQHASIKQSYRLTYSSEENTQRYENIDNLEPQLCQIHELIKHHDYANAHLQLQHFNKQLDQCSTQDQHYYNYLYACVNYNLNRYKELFDQATTLIEDDSQFIDQSLQLLVDAYLKTKQYQQALQYQLQLINRNQYDLSMQVQLAKIYLLLNKPQQAYYSYLHAYNGGQEDTLEQLTLLSYPVDKSAFLSYARRYLDQPQHTSVILIKILFWLAKESTEQQLQYQEQACTLLIQHNGMKNQHTYVALVNLAELQFNNNQFEDSHRNYELSVQIIQQIWGYNNIKYIHCLQRQSQCKYKLNQLDQSLTLLEKSYPIVVQLKGQSDPYTERTLLNMANLQIQLQQDYSNAMKLLFVTQNSVILNELGSLLQQHNYIDDAIQSYEMALCNANNDQQLLINLNLAGCFGVKQDYQRSVELYKECGQRMEANPEIERRIASVYKQCGRMREAMFHLKRGLTIARKCKLEQQIVEIQKEISQF